MNIANLDRRIQTMGGKNAGAAKLLLRKLIKQGDKGITFSSQEEAFSHCDVAILNQLGYLDVGDRVVLRLKLGVRFTLKPEILKDLAPKKKKVKMRNKKKDFTHRELDKQEIRQREWKY